jgi:NAD(P)-dependent dehydrogenase (short-subunit alcohol dehydrogenase family)
MASPDKRSKDNFDIQMQTNQLSHFLLASLVYDNVEKAATNRGEARIVTQSSSARSVTKKLISEYFETSDEGGLGGDSSFTILQMMGFAKGPWTRYGQSKLANSVYAMALHDKLQAKDSKVKSVCCEPGFSVTNLQTTDGYHGWMEMMEGLMNKQSAADGSLNACMASFSDDAKSGDFYVPEKGLVGPPKKVIEAGVVVPKGNDQPTCDPENKTLVWEACEKACGVEWKI